MNEPFSEELLSAYFDDELSSEQRAVVEKHLHDTPAAIRQLENIGRISNALKSLPQEPAPVELSSAVLKEAERQSLLPSAPPVAHPQSRLQTASRTTAWGMVSLTAGFFLVVGLMDRFPTHQSSPLMSSIETEDVALTPQADYLMEALPATETEQQLGGNPAAGFGGAGQPESATLDERNRRPAKGLPFLSVTNGIPALKAPSNSDLNFSNATADLTKVEIGDVIPYLEMSEDRAAFIEVTVVDIQQALGTMQVLLAKNSIQSYEEFDQNRQTKPTQDMFAVYVEADADQLLSAIEEMKTQHQDLFLGLNLKGPVDVSEKNDLATAVDGLALVDQEQREFAKERFSRASSAVRKALTQTPNLTEEKGAVTAKPTARSFSLATIQSLSKAKKSVEKKEDSGQLRNPTAPPPPLPTPGLDVSDSQAFQVIVQIPNQRQLVQQKKAATVGKNASRGNAPAKSTDEKSQMRRKSQSASPPTRKSVRVIFLLQMPATKQKP